jgi:hypothetical protein
VTQYPCAVLPQKSRRCIPIIILKQPVEGLLSGNTSGRDGFAKAASQERPYLQRVAHRGRCKPTFATLSSWVASANGLLTQPLAHTQYVYPTKVGAIDHSQIGCQTFVHPAKNRKVRAKAWGPLEHCR